MTSFRNENMKRTILPYNPGLKKLAKKLRNNMTFSEIKLWNELKNGKMQHYDFDRQRPIDEYIVDFYCKDLMLAVEVDGIIHDDDQAALKDANRQQRLEYLGVQFLRFNALDVVHDIENVCRAILHWIVTYEEEHGVPEHIAAKRKLRK